MENYSSLAAKDIHMTRFVVLNLFVLMSLCVGCQREPAKKLFNDADLVGQWKGDFDETWKVSKSAFMKDTLRGEDAYPKDPAEKEKVVRQEVEPIINNMAYDFRFDGTFSVDINGIKDEGKYRVEEKGDNTFTVILSVETPSGKDEKPGSVETEMKFTILDLETIDIFYNETSIIFKRIMP